MRRTVAKSSKRWPLRELPTLATNLAIGTLGLHKHAQHRRFVAQRMVIKGGSRALTGPSALAVAQPLGRRLDVPPQATASMARNAASRAATGKNECAAACRAIASRSAAVSEVWRSSSAASKLCVMQLINRLSVW